MPLIDSREYYRVLYVLNLACSFFGGETGKEAIEKEWSDNIMVFIEGRDIEPMALTQCSFI